ncbi:hypothetical protein NKH77_11395 [Streptomyces sp. M19]
MRPHISRAPDSPRLPRGPRPRAVSAACAAVALAAVTAGCATETGARDGGAAPSLSAPVSASPLWPDYTPPSTPVPGDGPQASKPYLPVEEVTVPARGLRAVSAKDLLDRDPNVPGLVRSALKGCPGDPCGLRAPSTGT